MQHHPSASRHREPLPPANPTADLAGIVLISLAWLGVSTMVVGFAADQGAEWARYHGGRVIFSPLFGTLGVCSWVAVVYRLRARRWAAAAWWTAFACLPSLLTLQIAGVL